MSASQRRFTQEFKDDLCQEVITTSKTIKTVAEENGVGAETLRTWLKKYRNAGNVPEEDEALNVSERARLKELERENRELKAEAAFLKKAAAYFAREPR